MNPALLRLLVDSVRGRIVRSVRLIRQPRYLVGFLVGAAWFGAWVLRPALGALTRGERYAPNLPTEALWLIQLGIALGLAVGITLTWLLPHRRLSLGLSATELEILSSAPVRRRDLIQYALVKNQAGILFGALIMTLLVGSGGPGRRLLWFVSFWTILTNWDLHAKGCALFKARLRTLPRMGSWMLRTAGIAVGLTFWAIVLVSIVGPAQRVLAVLQASAGARAWGQFLATAWSELGHGGHRVVLAPLLWLLEPGVALSGASRGAGMVALSLLLSVGLVLAQNEWVVRSQFKFEESALDEARRESVNKAPFSRYRRISRARRMQSPFELRLRGAPGVALLWKAMIQVRRGSLKRHAGLGAALAMTAGLGPALLGAPLWVSATILSIGFGILALASWLVPMYPRNDLHTDLMRLEVIRPWPVSSVQVFACEVLAPTIEGLLAVGFAACLIVSAHAGMQLGGAEALRTGLLARIGLAGTMTVPLLVLGLLPVAAALSFLTATLINLAVLFMPGWVPLGPHKSKGAAAFGHDMLVSLGLFLCNGIALVAATIVAGTILLVQVFALGLPFSAWEIPFLGLVAALPAAAAVALGLRTGAALWDRLDASREVLDQTG